MCLKSAAGGVFTNYIKCKSYTGLEFSEDAIKKAKDRGLKIFNESIERHAGTHALLYDVVCYFQVLEHVPNPGDFITYSLKCLRPGGKLLVAVPSEDSFIKNVVNFYLNMPPHHASRWTDNTLRKVADLFNLQLVHLFHEPLHAVHRRFYVKTMIHKKMAALLGGQPKIIDNNISTKIIYGISHITSIIPSLLINFKNVVGQSLLVVYMKS
jgi:SAM-dependent methyltransferase